EDVLVLLCNANHLVAPAQRQNLRETGVEPDSFEDHIESDKVAQQRLVCRRRTCAERRIAEALRVLDSPRRLLRDGGNFAIHVEELTLVQPQAFDDVLKGMRVYCLLEGLAQQILPAFRI